MLKMSWIFEPDEVWVWWKTATWIAPLYTFPWKIQFLLHYSQLFVSPSLEMILKWVALLQSDGVRRHLRKGLQGGRSALTKQRWGRDRHKNGLSIKMHGHSHHLVCILLPGQVPTLGNCLLNFCLKPWCMKYALRTAALRKSYGVAVFLEESVGDHF